MKKHLLFFFTLLITCCYCNRSKPVPTDNDILSSVFSQDSGYILQIDGIKLLGYLNLLDTLSSNHQILHAPATDTIGKYYKMSSDSYMAFILNKEWQIIEIDTRLATVQVDSISTSDNYICCWDSEPGNMGFVKLGSYFGLKLCGAGASYCSSSLYLFRHVNEVENTITEYIWDNLGFMYTYIDSRIEETDEGIKVHYTYEEGHDVSAADTLIDNQPTFTKQFVVDYILKGKRWHATDSTVIRGLNLEPR